MFFMNGSGRKSHGAEMPLNKPRIEWITLGLIIATHALWLSATTWIAAGSLPLAIVILALVVALYSSLQHEVIHGHPTPSRHLNESLVFPALTVLIPYRRFRDDHLAHHRDERLTDPYDDPETNFLDPVEWRQACGLRKLISLFNNTLLGRILIGTAIAQFRFVAADLRRITQGNRAVLNGWLHHLAGLVPVTLWMIWVADMPILALLGGTYAGLSIIKIRTFLEHQAHTRARARTVVIEDRGPLAFLFLNNNFHVVHHMHPRVPWYRLPALYAANKARYLRRNEGYRYASYSEVFRKYLWRRKDPVAHPLMEEV